MHQPGGARAFVSCGPDNYVAVIDLKTLEVSGHIDAVRIPTASPGQCGPDLLFTPMSADSDVIVVRHVS